MSNWIAWTNDRWCIADSRKGSGTRVERSCERRTRNLPTAGAGTGLGGGSGCDGHGHRGRNHMSARRRRGFGELLRQWARDARGLVADLLSLRHEKKPSGYLFVAINGAGLGHLTRCLAVATRIRKRAPEENIVFVTTSIAVPLVHQAGFVCHHITPFALAGREVSNRQWNVLFRGMLAATLRLHRPSTLVFDGSSPYEGLVRAMNEFEHVARVWIKRGGYKASVDAQKLAWQAGLFDLTICPGELGDGVGATQGSALVTVDPILLVDRDEMLDRTTARKRLRLQDDSLVVFVQLGAGNINQTTDLQGAVIRALKKMDAQVVLAQSPIALNGGMNPFADRTLIEYPSCKYYGAFDFAVLAGGYNSVNEAVLLDLPTIFIPNAATRADDQLKRCQSAKRLGNCEVLEVFDEMELLRLSRMLLARAHRSAAIERDLRNGAEEAADLIMKIGLSREPLAAGG